MTIEMNKLREIAKRATPGKWEGWTSSSVTRITAGRGVDGGVLHATMVRREYAELVCSDADRAHIAAACPDQILALLDQFEALQREKARLSAPANTLQLHNFAKAVVLEAGGTNANAGDQTTTLAKSRTTGSGCSGIWAGRHCARNDGDQAKALHRTITAATLAANWHAAVFCQTNMRPGINPAEHGIGDEVKG